MLRKCASISPTKKRPQQAGLVDPMRFGNGAATVPAPGTGQGAFEGEDQFTVLGEFGLQHTDIGDVERNRDERLLWHQTPLVKSTGKHGLIVHHACPMRKLYI
jgi:hypothetical protein